MDGSSSVEERVFEVMKHVQPQDNLKRETVIQDLNWDSLDYMELLSEMEEEFNIHLSEEQLMGFKTVGCLIEHIEKE